MRASRSGSWRLVAALLFIYLPTQVHAELSASLDRYRISMGETVRLTLSSNGDSDPADADLSALEEHFDILQRSSSVSTRIVNGSASRTRELNLELTPRREGSIVIPPFEAGDERSEALAVDVDPEPSAGADDEVVTFEAELDRKAVYVQGQLLLTLRVQQAVNLESRSVTELELDNAFVQNLGQNSFQRMIGGRPWLVHEIRYAIFPEASGELRIPAQTFSGRMGSGRRSLFDTRPTGRLIRRRTEDIIVDVLPRPAQFTGATWLPAESLSIEEQWSGAQDQLRIGDSLTRTISVTGKGLQGAQLPPIEGPGLDGLRVYPDQPGINDVTGEEGVTGVRTDSLALVATAAGEYELPAVEIPWWDTGSNSQRVARLPARRVRVLPAPLPTTALPPADTSAATRPAISTVPASPGIWPLVAAFCAGGWLLTSLLWWRRGRGGSASVPAPTPRSRDNARALLRACERNAAAEAREELLAWIRGQGYGSSLAAWQRRVGDPALDDAVAELERHLYAGDGTAWNGEALRDAIRTLPQEPPEPAAGALPALYLNR